MKTPDSNSTPNQYGVMLARSWRRAQPWLRIRQAVVMMLSVALFLTSLPLFGGRTQTSQAQITQRICDPSQPGAANQIFQKCAISNGIEGALETEAINGLLSLHNLPASDRSRLVNWERNKIRAALFEKLSISIQKNPAQRTANEQGYVTAMTSLVKARRVASATEAISEYNKWATTCPYTPPPGFVYNNGTCESAPFIRLPPPFEAFQAYGAARANSELQSSLAQQAAMQQTAKQVGTLAAYAGIAAVSGIAAAIGLTLVTVTSVTVGTVTSTTIITAPIVAAVFPYAAVTTTGTVGAFPAAVGAATIAAPVAMFLFAIVTGVLVGIEVFEAEEVPGKLQDAKNRAMNETPDLAQLITTDIGRREVFGELMQATFPEFPASGSAPAAQPTDQKFHVTTNNSIIPTLQYKDWENNDHAVRLNSGWFVDRKGTEAERLTLGIEYKDWAGKRWSATRRGAEFWHAPGEGNDEQPYKSLELKYLDSNNAQKTALIDNAAPTISPLSVTRRQEPPVPSQYLTAFPNANVSQIATVSDLEDAAGSLSVAVTSANPSNGITLSELRVDANGKVFARVQPSCNAVVGNTPFTLEVRDSMAQTATATVNVTVNVNALPVLGYPSLMNVAAGGALVVYPAAGPSDDGGALGQVLFNGNPALSVGPVYVAPVNSGAPAFAGTIQVSPSDARITVQNAGPVGDYYVATSLTDSCGQITSAMFTLRVSCSAINFTTSTVNPTYTGATNGQITVNASGGYGAMRYSINGGTTFQTSNVFSGLAAGNYIVTVKDSANCSAQLPKLVTLVQPTALAFTTSTTNPTCNGASNGAIIFNATGGVGARQFSVNGGQSFQPSHLFSGLAAGTYNLVVKDANGTTKTGTATLTQPNAVVVGAVSVPSATAGNNYQAVTFNSIGGTGNRTLSLTGALPEGMQFTNGVLSGTPVKTGFFFFTVTATDQNGCTASRSFTLFVTCAGSTVTPASLPSPLVGVAYNQQFSATPAGANNTYSVASGTLPTGLALSASGSLSGTPTQTGTFNFRVRVNSNWGSNTCAGWRDYQLTVTNNTSLRANNEDATGEKSGKAITNDFDGDGKSDLVNWRGETNEWLITRSSDDQTEAVKWEAGYEPNLDVIVNGDFDGDSKADLAVFKRADARWFIRQSSDGAMVDKQWGLSVDTPVAADYDADGKTDIAVWRGLEGTWYVLQSSNGKVQTMVWGNGRAPYFDVPVPADYDGDGKADFAVFRQTNGHWYIKLSSDGSVLDKVWGMNGDVPVTEDYDGDGKSDIAVWREAEGVWYILHSSDGLERSISLGVSSLGDVPAIGDYDGDGKADAAVWRVREGRLYAQGSQDAATITRNQGRPGELPIVRQ
ncbi:MAG: FG-GAP-like repeat-containing protein [Acidobacteriota bacterium]|nr:FG-GAP-like repeat-containing protein [Acidobacteriota bacterium]